MPEPAARPARHEPSQSGDSSVKVAGRRVPISALVIAGATLAGYFLLTRSSGGGSGPGFATGSFGTGGSFSPTGGSIAPGDGSGSGTGFGAGTGGTGSGTGAVPAKPPTGGSITHFGVTRSAGSIAGAVANWDQSHVGPPLRPVPAPTGELLEVPFGAQLQVLGSPIPGAFPYAGARSNSWYPAAYNGIPGFMALDDLAAVS